MPSLGCYWEDNLSPERAARAVLSGFLIGQFGKAAIWQMKGMVLSHHDETGKYSQL